MDLEPYAQNSHNPQNSGIIGEEERGGRRILHFSDSDALCRWVREQPYGDKVVVSFSAGKDSLGSWLQLLRYWKPEDIYPVHMVLVPGLRFVEEGLTYYEQVFGRHILRLPHNSFYRFLKYAVFQAPQNLSVLDQAPLIEYDFDMFLSVAKGVLGLHQDTFSAMGVRATDSLNRWSSIKQFGPVNLKRQTFFPIFDWRKDRLVNEIQQSGIKLPVDYLMFGRSFDGLDYRFLKPIKEHYPDDYARILEWFPLAELELLRIQYREAYYQRVGEAAGAAL